MVKYEVNLVIQKEIFDNYYTWLVDHIKEMLKFHGFKKASISKEISKENLKDNYINLTVLYNIETKQDLDNYLEQYAPHMRADGIKKFGNKFSAHRRVFELVQNISN